MTSSRYSQLKFVVALGIGVAVASMLCVQCIRTFLYADSVLIPQQAARDAERLGGSISAAARAAGITDPRSAGPLLQHALESSSDHVLWIRVLDLGSHALSEAGKPQGGTKVPAQWWDRVEKRENLGTVVTTLQGKVFVAMLPFRMSRPLYVPTASSPPIQLSQGIAGDQESSVPSWANHPPRDGHPAYALEVAIPLKAAAGAFEGLRENLILGLVAAIALLVSLAIIGFRTRSYLRGRYLESELRLAQRVQSDLQPKPQSISPHFEFAASASAADHVGEDFYDIFAAEPGKIVIVLGDVSGKGVPAALLVSVLQGAIRSSGALNHESACERINRMLCERTAHERFATLFWGVLDVASQTLRYVNAGHVAPILIRHDENRLEQLVIGGPVLGLLPNASYSVGEVQIASSNALVLYSDGISEAMNKDEQEFGVHGIGEAIANTLGGTAAETCNQIMNRLTSFANADVAADDRTLMVVRFLSRDVTYPVMKDMVEETVA